VLIFNVPHLWLRYQLTFIGYAQGNRFLQRIAGSQVMDQLTSGAAIVGLMVVGAMPALLMSIKTSLQIGAAGSEIPVQGILDQIVPGLLPLALTFLTYALLKRNVKTTYLLLGLLFAGFMGSVMHVLA
jgi:PTS system mannose-specific IID component